MDISLSNAIIAETAQQRDVSVENVAATLQKVVEPLLGGTNVRVSETLVGDLQKLLAQLRSEQEERKVKLAHQQLSAVLGQLCAMENLTAEQESQVNLMQMKIEALEAAIERETVTAAERKKAIETKRLLEAQAKKELDAAEATGDEQKISEAKAKLVAVQDEISGLDKEIAALEAKISSLKRDVASLGDEVSALLSKLDYSALVTVLAAITLSAAQASPEEKQKQEDEEALKIPTPLEVVRESIEKAVEDIREEIVEKRIQTV